MTQANNIHPGEILQTEFLEPLEMTPYYLAKSIGVPKTRIAAILHGRRGITAETALLLGRFFGTGPELWLNLQKTYELREAAGALSERLERIQPVESAGALIS